MHALLADEPTPPLERIGRLVDTLDGLEHRIFGGPPPEDRLIPVDRLLRIVRQAGKNCLSEYEASAALEDQRPDLSSEVRRIIETEDSADRNEQLLSISHAALLQVSEYLFRFLEYAANIDPRAYTRIQYLQMALAQVLIREPDALHEPDHPARRLLETLVVACKKYDRYSGKRADAFMARVGALVEQTVQSIESTEDAFETAWEALSGLIETFEKETVAFARSLIIEEKSAVLKGDAKLAVNREILSAVTGKKLPLILLQFLQQVWSKYLYVTYLRQGLSSPEWTQGVEDIHTLVSGFAIREREELTRFYSAAAPKPLPRIRACAASIHADEALVKKCFWALDTLHLQITEGSTPSIDEYVTVGNDDLMPSSAPSVPDEDSLHSVSALRVGSWFKFPHKGLEIRSRLIEKDAQHGYCLFSNLSGTRVVMQKFSDIKNAVRAGTLKPIDTTPVFESALTFACRQIADQIPKLEAKAQQTERERDAILERKRQEQEAENLRRLEEERLRQETQMLEEKRRREQERARRESEARAQAEDAERDDAMQQVLNDIERMQPSGWAEFIDDDGHSQTCKLGLKLRSTGKLIFVDQLGRKVQELLPVAIAKRILDGTANIVDYGVAYDHGLQSLISERDERFDDEQ